MAADKAFPIHSFAGGLCSRLLNSRSDTERYYISARTLNNMMILRSGDAANRSGFEHLGDVKTPSKLTRLQTWLFDDDDRYILELGHLYIRFWQDGGRIVTASSAAWSATKLYVPGDLVVSASVEYYCKLQNVNKTPASSANYWYALTVVTTSPQVSIYEIPSPFGQLDVFDAQFQQSADVTWIVHPSRAPHELKRYGTTTWTLMPAKFTPSIEGPPGILSTSTGNAITDYYKVTSVKKDTEEESLPGHTGSTIQSTSDLTNAGGAGKLQVTSAGIGLALAVNDDVLVLDVFPLSGVPDAEFEASLEGNVYNIGAVGASTFDLDGTAGAIAPVGYRMTTILLKGNVKFMGINTPSDEADVLLQMNGAGVHGFATGDEVLILKVLFSIGSVQPTFVEALENKRFTVTVINTTDLTLDDTKGIPYGGGYDIYLVGTTLADAHSATLGTGDVTLIWVAVKAASHYYVYKKSNGVFGYLATVSGITSTNVINYIDKAIAVVGDGADTSDTPPKYFNPFRGTDKFPGVVGMHDQRLCFGATNEKPADFWLSRVGDFLNFTHSSPFKDDDAINGTIIGAQEIRHFLDLDQLIVVSNAALYFMEGDADGALIPQGVRARQRGRIGASKVQPLIIDDSVLYVASRSGTVRDFRLDAVEFQKGRDLMTYVPSIIDGFDITQWCYQRVPQSIVWATRDDGKLLSLTYVREQEINAWATHDTGVSGVLWGDPTLDAGFESVAAIPDGDEDSVYAVVNRTHDPTYDYGVIYEPPTGYRVACLAHWTSDSEFCLAVMSTGTQEVRISTADITGGNPTNLVITALTGHSSSHDFHDGQSIVCVGLYKTDGTNPSGALSAALLGQTFVVAASAAATFELAGTSGVTLVAGHRASFAVPGSGRNRPACTGSSINIGKNGHGNFMPGTPALCTLVDDTGCPSGHGWWVGRLEAEWVDLFQAQEDAGCTAYMRITLQDQITGPGFIGADDVLDTHLPVDAYNGMIAQLQELGKGIATYNKPIFMEFCGECNSPHNGYHRGNFADAFNRAINTIAAQVIASTGSSDAWRKVARIWTLEATPPPPYDEWYPGDGAVDWCGVDIFSANTYLTPGTPSNLHLEEILTFFTTLGKPAMIPEVGATGLGMPHVLPDAANGGDEVTAAANADAVWKAWWEVWFKWLDDHPTVKIWFYSEHNFTGEAPSGNGKDDRLAINHFLRERYMARVAEGRYINADQRSLLKDWRTKQGLSTEPEGPTVTRTVERMRPRKAGAEDYDELFDSFFVDGGGQWDGRNSEHADDGWDTITLALSAGTTYEAGSWATLTADASLFAAADVNLNGFRLTDPTTGDLLEVWVTAYTSDTVVEVQFQQDCPPTLLAGVTTLVWTKMVGSIGGLSRLESRILNVLGDGKRLPTVAVANAVITLQQPYGIIYYGLPITAEVETMDLDAPGSAVGGVKKRTAEVVAVVDQTRGVRVGPSGSGLLVPLKETPVVSTSETALFSGKATGKLASGANLSGSILLRQAYPFPMLIEGIYPTAEV